MIRIEPFSAILYNQEKIKDLSRVSCPPYDIISPSAQKYYHELSPYNFIHILLGKDIPGQEKYRRAGKYFRDWLKNKIFIQDEKPAIYFYSQKYTLKGEERIRLGFIALLRLEDKNSSVFGHEHTRLEPKEDRLRLLRQVRANLSPIFVIFPDKKRLIHSVYQQCIKDEKSFIDIIDEEKTIHKLWRIDNSEILHKIKNIMQGTNIFIADGHHRYEVACAYKDENKRKLGTITSEEDFNYIMAYFTQAESRGLTILPVHRFVNLDKKLDLENFKAKLKDYFDIDEIKDKARFFFLLEKAGGTEHVIGMYKERRYWLLRLKNVKILDKMIGDKPMEYRSLNVPILNQIILQKILGLDLEDKDSIAFSPNPIELIERVDRQDSSIAFFLNPVKIQQIMQVASNGYKLPAKSTYFYPKVLSGLVINKFNEDTPHPGIVKR